MLYASVYQDDDEAVALWKKVAGLPDDRIVRLGKKDNYWSMGVPGPGGPSSEILIDRGPAFGKDRDWDAGDRYMEFWNLVFMQDELSAVRSKEDFDIAGPLPKKNIDTGMGLERVAYLLQGVENLYEIDEVFPVLERAAALSGKRYGHEHEDDVRLRVVADHVRSALMLISDGVSPGNEARGYVLRRLLRRVVRSMRLLGVEDPVLPELLPVSRDAMAPSYPELVDGFGRISSLAYAEEETFRQTLRAGTTIFDQFVREARHDEQLAETAGGPPTAGTITGGQAFQLHDTFGFPIDLTLEMAAEQGIAVDEAGFRRLMREQRERAKADARAKKTRPRRPLGLPLGARRRRCHQLHRVRRGGQRGAGARGAGRRHQRARGPRRATTSSWSSTAPRSTPRAAASSPTRAASGSATAPRSRCTTSRPRCRASSCTAARSPAARSSATTRRSARSTSRAGGPSAARTPPPTWCTRRSAQALGETATQAGSENAPGRFRFDFASPSAVPPSVMTDVEQEVNEVLAADLDVRAEVMTQDEARAAGAMALFGEKYGDEVRVVSVGDWARELCGGTHAQRSGQLGLVKILGESSIGAGVRRVEALVGTDAYQFLAREHALVSQLTDSLKVRPEELPERVAGLTNRLREVERDLEKLRSEQALAGAAALAADPTDVFGVGVVTHRTPDGTSADDLRRLVLDVRGRIPAERPAAVAMVSVANGRPVIVVAVNEKGREWGIKAGELVRVAAGVLGGGGGGKDDVAQGGGTDPAKADEALRQVEHTVGQRVTGST